uniref:GPN-loop GTPase 2 n=1 Tax=Strongyloides venezuelensis TaxID=75913 RepID=A0A0K0FRJ3_STRVS
MAQFERPWKEHLSLYSSIYYTDFLRYFYFPVKCIIKFKVEETDTDIESNNVTQFTKAVKEVYRHLNELTELGFITVTMHNVDDYACHLTDMREKLNTNLNKLLAGEDLEMEPTEFDNLTYYDRDSNEKDEQAISCYEDEVLADLTQSDEEYCKEAKNDSLKMQGKDEIIPDSKSTSSNSDEKAKKGDDLSEEKGK